MSSEYKFRIKCINLSDKVCYVPIFENNNKMGILTELFVERQSFGKEISKAIYDKKDFCGNSVGFEYGTDDTFNIYGIIEDGNANEHVFIKRDALLKIIRSFDSTISKIDVFGRLILELKPCIYDKFKCLDSTQDYFNIGGLCGIVNNDEKWYFCGQAYPEKGDHPNAWLSIREYESIDELIGDTVISLARTMFIARKRA